MTDLDRINQMEKITGQTFKTVPLGYYAKNYSTGVYTLDDQQRVIGLGLDIIEKPELAEHACALPNLQTLSLRQTRWPDYTFLSGLTGLTTLYLSSNQISDISFLQRLTSLTMLYLRGNKISKISFLQGLRGLTTLDLRGNKIDDISFLQGLIGLTTLDLRGNKINDISFLQRLIGLTKLDLGWNQIKQLPEFLLDFNAEITWQRKEKYYSINENEIGVEENPFEEPPINVIKQGKAAIRIYYDQIRDGTLPLYEARLMFVGEPGAGKTSLMQKLLDETHAIPNEADKSTLGICIRPGWRFASPLHAGTEFAANLWDFGGQEIQYLLHQFFLTSRCLYVLLADDRKQRTDFDYWFQAIDLLGGGSPTLVVLNEHDYKSITNFDLAEYRRRFPNLSIESCAVDLARKDGQNDPRFAGLQADIQKKLATLKHVGDPLPKRWPEVRQTLEQRREQGVNHIAWAEFQAVCAQHHIAKEDYQLQLSQYLHDLGILLHFQHDANLLDTVFLNPHWVVKALYEILADKTLETQQGEFDRDWLFRQWQACGYSRFECGKLLNLMLKNQFELCFPLDDRGERFLAPQLLPTSEMSPALLIGNLSSSSSGVQVPGTSGSLQFRYQYAFMPRGLMSRLIVRLHEYLAKSDGKSLCWRSGAILQDGNALAKITESFDAKTGGKGLHIVIWEENPKGSTAKPLGSRSSRQKELLRIIRHEIDTIHHRSFPNLKPTLLIPCNCESCQSLAEPFFFDYANLLHFRDKLRKTTRECGLSGADVGIDGLIEGVMDRENQKSTFLEKVGFSDRSMTDFRNMEEMVHALSSEEDEMDLQQLYKEKLERLQGAWLIENDHATKFKLEKQIAELKEEAAKMGVTLPEASKPAISESQKSDTPAPITASNEKEIFVSYAWGGDSAKMVDELDKTLQEKGITIIRDKRDLGYKGRIKDFMDKIGRGKAVIVVISKKYLESENCMYELVQIAKNGKFYDRIFPIVLEDAQIYKPVARIKYVKHWEDQIKELDEAMKTVNSANLQGFRESIDEYTEIRATIGELTNTLKDMNTLTPEMHAQYGFADMIKAIKQKMNE